MRGAESPSQGLFQGVRPMRAGCVRAEHARHDDQPPLPPMPALSRRRHRRLRRELAGRRERVRRSLRSTLRAQQRALRARPTEQPPVAGTAELARSFDGIARELRGRAGGDAQVKAAARGVSALADAYRDIAAAGSATDVAAAARLTRRSVKALETARSAKRRAGDAWPL